MKHGGLLDDDNTTIASDEDGSNIIDLSFNTSQCVPVTALTATPLVSDVENAIGRDEELPDIDKKQCKVKLTPPAFVQQLFRLFNFTKSSSVPTGAHDEANTGVKLDC